MTAPVPPPLPGAESAVATYLKAFGTVFPALFIWMFAKEFLLPKVEWLWANTNLGGSKVQWLLEVVNILTVNAPLVFGIVGVLFIVLEARGGRWPRYRRTVVAVFAVLFHTTVLLALTSIATAVLLAAPLLTRTKAPQPQGGPAPAGAVQ